MESSGCGFAGPGGIWSPADWVKIAANAPVCSSQVHGAWLQRAGNFLISWVDAGAKNLLLVVRPPPWFLQVRQSRF